jgi:hypothetical protein
VALRPRRTSGLKATQQKRLSHRSKPDQTLPNPATTHLRKKRALPKTTASGTSVAKGRAQANRLSLPLLPSPRKILRSEKIAPIRGTAWPEALRTPPARAQKPAPRRAPSACASCKRALAAWRTLPPRPRRRTRSGPTPPTSRTSATGARNTNASGFQRTLKLSDSTSGPGPTGLVCRP